MDGDGGSDHEDLPENSPTLREDNMTIQADDLNFGMQDSMMITPLNIPFEIHTAQPREANKHLTSNFTAKIFTIGDEKDFESSSEKKNRAKFNINKIKNNSESSSVPEKELRLSQVEIDKFPEKQTLTDI